MSLVSGELRPATFETIEGEIAALGDNTTRMGDAFEHAALHYLLHDPTVGFTDVWLWADWPDPP